MCYIGPGLDSGPLDDDRAAPRARRADEAVVGLGARSPFERHAEEADDGPA